MAVQATGRLRISAAPARALGHDFGAKVVAEGIERDDDLTLVRSLGFDMAQGFLFSSALPFDQLADLPPNFAAAPIRGARAAQ